MRRTVFFTALLAVGFLLFTGCRTAIHVDDEITIREELQDGKKTVVIENGIYKAVLVPELARFPLSQVFKTTGHEHFKHKTPLSEPNDRFRSYGGIIDSLPWVSGKVGETKLQTKGFLYSNPWSTKTGSRGQSAWFHGSTQIEYTDPVEGHISKPYYGKRVTGYAGSAVLRMDHVIRNVGRTPARFTLSLHARTAVADADNGDYFYAPGDKSKVYEMKDEGLRQKGIDPPVWTRWPFMEATDYRPQKERRHVFVFVPADWCVVGDEKYKETLFFIASPIEIADRRETMKMAVFMTNRGYLVEACVSYSISGNPEQWADPELNFLLQPRQECRFTMNLVQHQGISRKDLPTAVAVYPGCVVLEKPAATAVTGADASVFSGRLAVAAMGSLELRSGNRLLKKIAVKPGIIDLRRFGNVPADGPFSLVLRSAAGTTELGGI